MGEHPLERLERQWAFPAFPDPGGQLRARCRTYCLTELGSRPPVPDDDSLAWLRYEPRRDCNIGTCNGGPYPPSLQPLTAAALDTLPWQPAAYPSSFRTFAEQPELQARIRSVTDCYLELGDFAVRTDTGGRLIHFLTDRQWLYHWLLYVDTDGYEAVVGTLEPIGFDVAATGEPALPDLIALDGRIDLVVCADSFAEFIYRFWIENELWWALDEGRDLPDALARYVAEL